MPANLPPLPEAIRALIDRTGWIRDPRPLEDAIRELIAERERVEYMDKHYSAADLAYGREEDGSYPGRPAIIITMPNSIGFPFGPGYLREAIDAARAATEGETTHG